MNYLEEYLQRMLFCMDLHIEKLFHEGMPICHIRHGYFPYKSLNMCFVNDMVARIGEAFYQGYLPVVEVPGGEGIDNLWETFFLQPHEILGIDMEAYAQGKDHIIDIEPVWGPGYKANLIPRELVCATNLYQQFVKPNEISQEYIEKEINEIIGAKSVLGVLVRGTDLGKDHPKDHPVQPDLAQVLKDVEEELSTGDYDGIYLASEEEEMEEIFREYFPEKEILVNKRHYMTQSYYEARKTHDIIGLSDVMVENHVDLFTYGLEYLSSLFLLSKCNAFIAGNTLGSSAALFLNGGAYKKYTLYDLGFYD